MKISELQKQLASCLTKWGDVDVHLMDLHDEGSESIHSLEFDGDKVILGDLTRAQDNHSNSDVAI